MVARVPTPKARGGISGFAFGKSAGREAVASSIVYVAIIHCMHSMY